MVAVDFFTKFIFTIQLQQLTAHLLVRALTSIFMIFGAPNTLLTDKGGEFNNFIIKVLTTNWGIHHIFTATKNPQANGQAEVSVRIVTQGLMAKLMEARFNSSTLFHKWDTVLPAFIYSYNTTYNKRISCSPYKLMFGRMPPLAHNLRIEETRLLHNGKRSFYDCLQQSLKLLHDTAQRRQERFNNYATKHYDKYHSALKIKAGDLVFVSPAHNALIRKLSPIKEGPFKVLFVYKQKGTNEPTAVKVLLKQENRIIKSRVYHRYRVRVICRVNLSLYGKH